MKLIDFIHWSEKILKFLKLILFIISSNFKIISKLFLDFFLEFPETCFKIRILHYYIIFTLVNLELPNKFGIEMKIMCMRECMRVCIFSATYIFTVLIFNLPDLFFQTDNFGQRKE